MIRRNTFQKELVLEAVRAMKSHVTAETVYEYVQKVNPVISRGTVYRNLAVLAEEGKIRKVELPDAPDRYDFTLEKHYHIHCVCCGALIDVETDGDFRPEAHIRDAHGAEILDHDIIFKGICPACRKKEEVYPNGSESNV